MAPSRHYPVSDTGHYLLPPDICLSFTGDDRKAREAIEYMFEFCHPLPGPVPPCTDQLAARISINHDYLSRPLPGWLQDEVVGHRYDQVHAFYGPDGEVAALLAGDDGFVCGILDEKATNIEITLGRTTGPETLMMSPSAIFTPLLQEALQRRDRLIFHGAGVRLPDGGGILLLADSGGGKTTTALALVRRNCSLLADDLVILAEEHGEPFLHGIPEPLNLTAATREFFPELRDVTGLPLRDGVTDKVVFDLRPVYGDRCFADRTRLQCICMVRVTGAGPSLTPLPPQVALGKMIKGCTFAFNQRLSRATGARLFDLAAGIPCFELQTGGDPNSLGDWLIEQATSLAAARKQ
ncbi:MAG: hypothetical protein Kow0089_10180 [Desulfobulbaceae bacterium]